MTQEEKYLRVYHRKTKEEIPWEKVLKGYISAKLTKDRYVHKEALKRKAAMLDDDEQEVPENDAAESHERPKKKKKNDYPHHKEGKVCSPLKKGQTYSPQEKSKQKKINNCNRTKNKLLLLPVFNII